MKVAVGCGERLLSLSPDKGVIRSIVAAMAFGGGRGAEGQWGWEGNGGGGMEMGWWWEAGTI